MKLYIHAILAACALLLVQSVDARQMKHSSKVGKSLVEASAEEERLALWLSDTATGFEEQTKRRDHSTTLVSRDGEDYLIVYGGTGSKGIGIQEPRYVHQNFETCECDFRHYILSQFTRQYNSCQYHMRVSMLVRV